MARPFLALALALALVLLALPLPAAAKSLALVIGNDSYRNVPPLQKARADASGYAAMLEARGFDVTHLTDVEGREMRTQLAMFYDKIEPGDVVVFAFSGHGWSDGRENYLTPVDIRPGGSETLIAAESFPLRNGANGIIDEIHRRGPWLTVAIIDACRNNPFATDDGTRSIGLARGLVQVAAPTGTFIAFSAGEGQTALDRLSDADAEPYSVFTRHFLAELAKPQDLQTAFKATQLAVNRDAQSVGHPQRPAYYDEVIGSACLYGRCDEDAPVIEVPRPAATAPATRTLSPAEEWQDFKTTKSVAALEAFAARHEGTPYADLARERIAILTGAGATPTPTPTPAPAAAPAAAPAVAPPSWCPRAGTVSEKTICASGQLSALDHQMNAAYSNRKIQLGSADQKALAREQRAWIKARDTCGANESCLAESYRFRLRALGF